MKLLIDGDIIVYRCGFAGEKTRYDWWHKDDVLEPEEGEYLTANDAEPIAKCENAKEAKAWLEALPEEDQERYVRIPRKEIDPIDHVLYSTKNVMHTVQSRGVTESLCIFFSCGTPENWRTQFYPEYKANRPDRRPFWVHEIREYLERGFDCVNEPPYEADDLLAMEGWHDWREGNESLIVSIDKDLLQIPGTHFDWVKDEIIPISPEQAELNLTQQRITGDSTDNIKGIPGWGPAAAKDWIAKYPKLSSDQIVIMAYMNYYQDEALARYHAALNTALVTLPESDEHRAALTEDVLKCEAKLPKDSES